MTDSRTFDFRRLLDRGEMNSGLTWKVVRQDQTVRLDYDEKSCEGQRRSIIHNGVAVPAITLLPFVWIVVFQSPPWQFVICVAAFFVMASVFCFVITRVKLDEAADSMRSFFRRTPTLMVVDAGRLSFPPYEHGVPFDQIARVRIVKAGSKGGEYERTPIRNVVYVEVYETGGNVSRVPVAIFSTFEGAERPQKFLAQAAEVLRQFGPEVGVHER